MIEFDQLLREGRDHLRDLLELVAGVARQRVDLQALFDGLGMQLDPRLEIGLLRNELPHPEAIQALHQQADRAIRRAQQAVHGGDHADLVQIAGPGVSSSGSFEVTRPTSLSAATTSSTSLMERA